MLVAFLKQFNATLTLDSSEGALLRSFDLMVPECKQHLLIAKIKMAL